VAISGRLEHPYDDTKAGEEAVMSFGTPPPLIATGQILYSVATESQGYKLDGRQAVAGVRGATADASWDWRLAWLGSRMTHLARARVVWGMVATEPLGHPNAAWVSPWTSSNGVETRGNKEGPASSIVGASR